MAFQPIVDVETGEVVAHEALVRGLGGEGAASVLAQVTPTNVYAFDQACRVKAIELASQLGLVGRLNINFLPNAVYEPGACIRATLDAAWRTGFDTTRLTFEIVETEAIAEAEHLSSIVTVYRRQGFRVALDDFGTGYSGLARLAALRPDVIKIDRQLVQGCDTNPMKQAIAASVVSMARAIGISVVFEGVETVGEMRAIRCAGGWLMQGFLFSRPIFEGLYKGPVPKLGASTRSSC